MQFAEQQQQMNDKENTNQTQIGKSFKKRRKSKSAKQIETECASISKLEEPSLKKAPQRVSAQDEKEENTMIEEELLSPLHDEGQSKSDKENIHNADGTDLSDLNNISSLLMQEMEDGAEIPSEDDMAEQEVLRRGHKHVRSKASVNLENLQDANAVLLPQNLGIAVPPNLSEDDNVSNLSDTAGGMIGDEEVSYKQETVEDID
mmetsp:Transcript_60883/g.96778  ORF Transcript_60883/g.96778 Transcript_60883/m.96778 type:complete len:204 (-) Transcript_60883:17-628(-)